MMYILLTFHHVLETPRVHHSFSLFKNGCQRSGRFVTRHPEMHRKTTPKSSNCLRLQNILHDPFLHLFSDSHAQRSNAIALVNAKVLKMILWTLTNPRKSHFTKGRNLYILKYIFKIPYFSFLMKITYFSSHKPVNS